MANNEYEKKLDAMIERIENENIKGCLRVSSKNRAYPKDCMTNGALESLIREILSLEKRVAALEKDLDP